MAKKPQTPPLFLLLLLKQTYGFLLKKTSGNERNMNQKINSKTFGMLNLHGLNQLQVKMGRCIRLNVKHVPKWKGRINCYP